MSGRRGRAVATAAIVGLVAAACGGSKPGTNPSAGGGKPIMIGISLGLTGDFSDPAQAAQKGYQLWAETVNASGGLLGRIEDPALQPETILIAPELVVRGSTAPANAVQRSLEEV